MQFYEQETEVLNVDELKEREAWRAEILKAYKRGHYRRALLLMSANVGDDGNVESMIDGFCENASPVSNLRIKA